MVDARWASLGQEFIVFRAVEEKRKGASLEQVRNFVEETKQHVAHWVLVDDLYHLKRGGRVSAAAAVLGSTLNIKPLIYVDREGRLVPMGKVRGRKNGIKHLVDTMLESGENLEGQTVFLSHADCREDAEQLAALIR